MTTPEKIKGPVAMSLVLHAGLVVAILVSPSLLPFEGSEQWGSENPGSAVNAKIVSDISSGIPLPAPVVVNEEAAANDSKGLYKTEPAPPAKPSEDAIKIPETTKATPPKPTKAPPRPTPPPDRSTKASKTPEPATPSNAVPYGEGGKPALNYGQMSTQAGTLGAGISDTTFGTKYATYVQSMIRKISQNWVQGLIDKNITRAPRVYMSFDIERDGSITNVELKQSSGIPSLDNSAKRALYASNKLLPLPADYSGSRVNVSFYFEFIR
jgi:TonB family protein